MKKWESGPEEKWNPLLRSFNVPEFTAEVGPTFEQGPTRNELDFFLKFFPAFLVEMIVVETNNYARKVIENRPDSKWVEINVTEMWAYLGIFMVFSIMQIPK